jgi:hypothetical protein
LDVALYSIIEVLFKGEGYMEKRHSDTLTDRLECIVDAGCVQIGWNELYRWYEVKRVSAGTWRDLAERWQEVSRSKSVLKKVESPQGIYLFDEKEIRPLEAASTYAWKNGLSRTETTPARESTT